MIRLAIAEDHQSLIDGIKLRVEYEDDIEIVGTFNDGESLLKSIALKPPHVVLTDIKMPKMDGIELTELIKKQFPHIKVLAFTMFDQEALVLDMIAIGVDGYILKSASLKEVINAIRAIKSGKKYYDPNLGPINTDASGPKKDKLTKRQIEILKLVARRKTSREIAEALFISVHAVDSHKKNMRQILNLKGRGALLNYALEKKYRY